MGGLAIGRDLREGFFQETVCCVSFHSSSTFVMFGACRDISSAFASFDPQGTSLVPSAQFIASLRGLDLGLTDVQVTKRANMFFFSFLCANEFCVQLADLARVFANSRGSVNYVEFLDRFEEMYKDAGRREAVDGGQPEDLDSAMRKLAKQLDDFNDENENVKEDFDGKERLQSDPVSILSNRFNLNDPSKVGTVDR
jgi:hypothetical protein